jgi:hypothetical protein
VARSVFAKTLRRLAAVEPPDDEDEPDPDDDGDYTDDPNEGDDPNDLFDEDGMPIDSPEQSAADDKEIAAQNAEDAREAAAPKQPGKPAPVGARTPVKPPKPKPRVMARGGQAKTVVGSPLNSYLRKMASSMPRSAK